MTHVTRNSEAASGKIYRIFIEASRNLNSFFLDNLVPKIKKTVGAYTESSDWILRTQKNDSSSETVPLKRITILGKLG
jgi:hypothetical protein